MCVSYVSCVSRRACLCGCVSVLVHAHVCANQEINIEWLEILMLVNLIFVAILMIGGVFWYLWQLSH